MLSEDKKNELEALAVKGGTILLLPYVGLPQAMMFAIPGHPPRLQEIDVGAHSMSDLVEIVVSLVKATNGDTEQLLAIGGQLNAAGVTARGSGNLHGAVLCYRLALAIVWQLGAWDRVELLTGNQQTIRQLLHDLLRGSVTMAYPDGSASTPRSGLLLRAGDIVISPRPESDTKTEARRLLALIQADANDLYFRIGVLGAAAIGGEEHGPEPLARLQICCRLASIAGARDAPVRLDELVKRAAALGRHQDALVAILEQLEDFGELELMVDIEPESVDEELAERTKGFRRTWMHYLAEREHLDAAASIQSIVPRYAAAYRQLQYLRWKVTCGGGSFGHRLAFQISLYLQPIGRDYVYLLRRMSEPRIALSVSEQLHARSMVDWMARSHHTDRLVNDPMVEGSVNAVWPANADEIRAAANEVNAPLLVYLETRDGYDVWLQRPNGELISDHITDPSPLIRALFSQLPYTSLGRGPMLVGRGQRTLRPTDADAAPDELDECLRRLFDALVPPKIVQALPGEGQRLVVVADSLLEAVPFCALRTQDGRYLVERLEVVYWPSTTAWLLTRTAARARASALPGSSPDPQNRAVVVGDPDFAASHVIRVNGTEREVRLGRLPGTRRETTDVVAQLGGVPLLGPDATLENVRARARGVPILHIATHGVVLTEQPEDSFIALTDGMLTAKSLYFDDLGLETDLVVLSACQTALGGDHPDSLIGLTNAFLVAGANTVVSTLWSIDDEQTVGLISRFYGRLTRGDSIPAALRSAQRAVLEHPDLRHPYYWAAFKIVGSEVNPLHPPVLS